MTSPMQSCADPASLPDSEMKGDVGSIIIVVATDAPLLPHQLKRMARRASLGLARTGSISGNSSGDIFIAFSTANPHADAEPGPNTVKTVSNERISPLFSATVEATEEAIVNAMVGAKTMTGHRRPHRHRAATRQASAGAEEIQPLRDPRLRLAVIVGLLFCRFLRTAECGRASRRSTASCSCRSCLRGGQCVAN